MKKLLVWSVSAVLLFTTQSVWALNGAQRTGFSAINDALGGSGAASPQDISTLVLNPAGLTKLPRLVNFNLLFALPKSEMDTSASAALGNPAGLTQSNDDPVLLPGGGFTLPTSLFDDKFFFGIGIIPMAGFTLDFANSRLNPAISTNTFDTHTYYGLYKVLPSVAYELNDQWSFGMSVHVNYATLATNSVVPSSGFTTETTGADHGDNSFGIGVEVGALYKACDLLSVGVSYTSPQWMQEFERYTDILPNGLDLPQQANLGLAWTPSVGNGSLLMNTDFRWINWSEAKGGFGTPVAAPNFGLGWTDQFIGMFGTQYVPLEWLTLRAGYNYGNAAVPSGSVFANILTSNVAEHHISGGLGFQLTDSVDLDLSYIRTLSNTVTDDGSQTGNLTTGSFLRQSDHQMSAQVGLKF